MHLALAIPGDDALARHAQVVKLYPSMAHLQASIYLSYADGLSGWHEPGESLKLLVTAHTTTERLGLVLAHEYTHAATFSLGAAADDMPWWVEEGVAELLAPAAAAPGRGRLEWPAARAAMQQRARAHGVVDFRELADFEGAARAHTDAVYDQGRAMAAFVRGRHGDAGLRTWLRYLAAGASLEDATRETLGTSFADLERAFRAEVAPAR
ncbi:MAG: hypothetical protein HY908_19045 [Myxococcales bacterium]|nr:hypothetical protein [Myxococcales bacterium]